MELLTDQETFDKAGSKELVKVRCEFCRMPFTIPKYRAQTALKGNCKNNIGSFCSKKCVSASTNKSTRVKCKECGNRFEKKASDIKRSKSHFCNRSCAAKYNNRNKSFGVKKSKAEKILKELIIKDFPNIIVIENDRKLLGRLEIDLLLPEQKVAIEVNGPLHFKPIYGEPKYKQIKRHDNAKAEKLISLGYELIVVDVSEGKSPKRIKQIMLGEYPIIKSTIEKRTARIELASNRW